MSTTQHPLTDAAIAEMWESDSTNPWLSFRGMHLEEQDATLHAMRAAFDAGREHERTTPAAEDVRAWEPLNGGRVYVGDEVRQDLCNVTIIAVVGEVDEGGDPRTAEGRLIGLLRYGTWYVRRTAQPLPPERDGVVLVPAAGYKAITTAKGQEFTRLTFTTKLDLWYGPNLAARPGDWVIQTTAPDWITPGTWKVYGE